MWVNPLNLQSGNITFIAKPCNNTAFFFISFKLNRVRWETFFKVLYISCCPTTAEGKGTFKLIYYLQLNIAAVAKPTLKLNTAVARQLQKMICER